MLETLPKNSSKTTRDDHVPGELPATTGVSLPRVHTIHDRRMAEPPALTHAPQLESNNDDNDVDTEGS